MTSYQLLIEFETDRTLDYPEVHQAAEDLVSDLGAEFISSHIRPMHQPVPASGGVMWCGDCMMPYEACADPSPTPESH